MTNYNTRQLSRMDLPIDCAAFPGLSGLNTRAVHVFLIAYWHISSPHARLKMAGLCSKLCHLLETDIGYNGERYGRRQQNEDRTICRLISPTNIFSVHTAGIAYKHYTEMFHKWIEVCRPDQSLSASSESLCALGGYLDHLTAMGILLVSSSSHKIKAYRLYYIGERSSRYVSWMVW
jgi:hypothetical protein